MRHPVHSRTYLVLRHLYIFHERRFAQMRPSPINAAGATVATSLGAAITRHCAIARFHGERYRDILCCKEQQSRFLQIARQNDAAIMIRDAWSKRPRYSSATAVASLPVPVPGNLIPPKRSHLLAPWLACCVLSNMRIDSSPLVSEFYDA